MKDAGFLALSNLLIDSRPCGMSVEYGVVDEVGSAGGGATASALPDSSNRRTSGAKATRPSSAPRTDFRETWLWTEETVDPVTGEKSVSVKVPDTITSWYASGFAVSDMVGLGVAEPVELKTFKPFFVSLLLPYAVIRGEDVTLPAAVFNYKKKCISVEITLQRSKDFRLVTAPRAAACICGGRTATVLFRIRPSTLGAVPIQVSARTTATNVCRKELETEEFFSSTDTIIKKMRIEPEGVEQENVYNALVCLKDGGKDFKATVDLSVPDNTVKGSIFSEVSIIGDLMGPSLSNIDELLAMPYGCGEQNMLKFAPNIFIMQYLESTDQVTKAIERKAKEYMLSGYQRELTYKHKDGSYSAFGERGNNNGSMWLTAFVLKSFAQARPYLDIDPKDITDSIRWITRFQDSEGCFPTVGLLHNKLMKISVGTAETLWYLNFSEVQSIREESGQIVAWHMTYAYGRSGVPGIRGRKGKKHALTLQFNNGRVKGGVKSPVTLTAYVLVALLEADVPIQDPAIQNALECITPFVSVVQDSYSLSILSYALAKAKLKEDLAKALNLLESKAIVKGGLKHWGVAEQKKDEDENRDSWWYRPASSGDIEMTAYALLAHLELRGKDAVGDVVPIVRWLTQQRNSLGGWSSTQDTVLAMQALARYAQFVYGEELKMSMAVTSKNGFKEVFSVNKENSLILQKAQIEKVPTVVSIKASGKGCSLAQISTKYNIEKEPVEQPAFKVNVTLSHIRSNRVLRHGKCHSQELTVCAKWLKDDVSNMAIINIRMVSGFVPNKKSLKKALLQSKTLKDYEFKKRDLVLYYSRIVDECVTLRLDQDFIVRKTKPVPVTVYDYYDKDQSATTMYQITDKQCKGLATLLP